FTTDSFRSPEIDDEFELRLLLHRQVTETGLAAAGLGGSMAATIPGYGRPGGGVRPDQPTPLVILPYRLDLHHAGDYGAGGKHVKVVVVPFAERREAEARAVLRRRALGPSCVS